MKHLSETQIGSASTFRPTEAEKVILLNVDGFEVEDDPDRQGLIRTVKGAHLVYKRKQEDGTYDELSPRFSVNFFYGLSCDWCYITFDIN